MSKQKTISICADDFGQHQAIDASVLQLLENGRLSGTSCLVHGQSFQRSAQDLRYTRGQKGLHVNFTELLSTEHLVWPLKKLIVLAYLQRLPEQSLRQGITAQLDLFEQHMQQAPDYIDGHQHVHQLPQIRDVLLEIIVTRYGANSPWLRYTGAERVTGQGSLSAQSKPRIIALLGAGDLARLAAAKGISMNAALTGVYNFQGGRQAYATWMQHWLSVMQQGDSLMCHPALSAVPNDALGSQRQAEHEVLCSTEMASWLEHYQLRVA